MQGIAALMAMNSLEIEADLKKMGWGSAEHLHAAIESMRLGFVDTLQYNADPQVHPVCLEAYSCFIFRACTAVCDVIQGSCSNWELISQGGACVMAKPFYAGCARSNR